MRGLDASLRIARRRPLHRAHDTRGPAGPHRSSRAPIRWADAVRSLHGAGRRRAGRDRGVPGAPGPMGWRSFSQVQTSDPSPHAETLDFAVDAAWRLARLRIDTVSTTCCSNPRRTARHSRVRTATIEIAYGPDVHLDYFSPPRTRSPRTASRAPPRSTSSTSSRSRSNPSRVRQRYELAGDERVGDARRRVRGDPVAVHRAGLRLDVRPVGRRRHRRAVRAPVRARVARPRCQRSPPDRLRWEHAG